MSFKTFIIAFLSIIFFYACSEDDGLGSEDNFVAAFESPALQMTDANASKEVKIVFSRPAPSNGNIEIGLSTTGLVYGLDNNFITQPKAQEHILTIPVVEGDSQATFTFISNTIPETDAAQVEFSIDKVSIANARIQGNAVLTVTYGNSSVPAGNIAPEIGGPNEPNQVFVDLSQNSQKIVQRDKWDLGFYNGETMFRVKINGALYMFARSTGQTDMSAVDENSVTNLLPEMDFLVAGSDAFVDKPSGEIEGTAIKSISEINSENPVYVLKLGSAIGTNTPETGSVAIAGESRGYKKIRILRSGEGGYLLRYADLNDENYQEVDIPKTTASQFTHFSFNSEGTVEVAPQPLNWDLKFTVFTEVLDLPEGGQSAYGFSDFIVTNRLSNVQAYQVDESTIAYGDFTAENLNENSFLLDQTVIGSKWRSVFEGVYADRFFIVKDPKGNVFKLKFTAFVNNLGERGYPRFKYKLL